MGRHQIVSSMARPQAAMPETMGTWARQVPGSSMAQFLEKGMQRKETMRMEKRIQRTFTMLHARTVVGS